jgi:RNA polymerase sigma-70 factor, ECF subfamily
VYYEVIVLNGKLSELFEQLYYDNQPKVYRLALGLAGNAADAEEITQEAFCRAFHSFGEFRRESSFFTWIYRITLNVTRDYLKKRRKLPIFSLTEDLGYALDQIIDPNPANNPETELLANEVRVRCLHCFTECLPTRQRTVFCLAVTLELPYKIIAEIMDCSVGSVKVMLHRAKKRIAGYLEDRCQLIKKSNPCNCRQWVRFGLEKGLITTKNRLVPLTQSIMARPQASFTVQIKEEIVRLQTLKDIYQDLYQETADEVLAQRIKQGIMNKEWAVFF